MSSNRDNAFPSTSIGRSSGIRVQQSASSAEAHPLLSPGESSPTPSISDNAGGASDGPKYLPYTPRQRVTTTAATTGTTMHPPLPPQHQGDATSKLQLMHLKAAAQGIGLDSGTLGWSMLEKLVVDAEITEEWDEIWHALSSGKATLLLPLESAHANEKITADLVKDHVILCEGFSRKKAPIITLTGLRGILDEETFTIRSTIYPTSKIFQDILNPTTRSTALCLLPSLPAIHSSSYPQFSIPSHSPSLHLPPRTLISTKPPLPPRPTNRPAPPSTNPSTSSRISNPFASLFGGKAPTPSVPPSPPTSLLSIDSGHDASSPIEVSAFTIDRRIVRKDIAKEINKALKGEVKAALTAAASLGNIPIPTWVSERVHDVTTDWYPFIKKSPGSKNAAEKGAGKEVNGNNAWIVNPIEESPDDAAERLQDFYLALEQDMRIGGTPFLPRRKEKDGEGDMEDEKEREKRVHERLGMEMRVRDVMEAIERTITSLFYDRLFMQASTDDASHDEALSSRVAALNMLDLGLGHLGIDVGEVKESDLDALVKACGDKLTKLDTCRSPADKSAILVAAHKIVVDRLSKLPPIRLISEHDAHPSEVLDDDEPETAKPITTTPGPPSSNAESSNYLTAPIKDANTILKGSSLLIVDQDQPPTTITQTKSSHMPVPPNQEKPPSSQREPTPVSGDVLLPLIIFSVVKANPPHLVSNLLFTQRFRNQSVGGEESYCLINLMAVAEFLENVDMAALGLGDSDKVMSTADLTPIPLTRSPVTSEMPLEAADFSQGLRGRVGQQVDAIADSANKVISGVVDSSFGILRSFMPTNANADRAIPRTPSSRSVSVTPGFGLLRKESGFSIASLAASLPIARPRSNVAAEESGQQLVTVSRPSSVRSKRSLKIKVGGVDSDEEVSVDGDHYNEDDDESASSGDDNYNEEKGGESERDGEEDEEVGNDVRSIRSFESMLSASKERSKSRSKSKSKASHARISLSDRLASVSALAGLKGASPPASRRSSLQPHQLSPMQKSHVADGSPSLSRAPSPVPAPVQFSPQGPLRLAPPKKRFIECTPDDLRLSEVGELLRDYRRLVEAICSVGGFEE